MILTNIQTDTAARDTIGSSCVSRDTKPVVECVCLEKPQLPFEIPVSMSFPSFLVLDEEGTRLNLFEPPKIKYQPVLRQFRVEGWNVVVHQEKASEIGREVARQFLRLFRKAERSLLSQDEVDTWEYIADRIDYQRFCAMRVLPRYAEAELLSRTEDKVTIRWADGRDEELPKQFGLRLSAINENEIFGCYAKFDSNDRTSDLTDVLLIGSAAQIDSNSTSLDWMERLA
jgi:hypothetical protein